MTFKNSFYIILITISKLVSLSTEELFSIGNPAIEVKAKYEIVRQLKDKDITFSLQYKEIKKGFEVKFYSNSSIESENFNKLIKEGNSFGAYYENKLIGFVISEKRTWNNSLWIEMIQVAKDHRGQGIGSKLLKALEIQAASENFRIIDIETQNTNIPAVNFYRKNGYEVTGLNLALYDPDKVNDDIAIFLAKNL